MIPIPEVKDVDIAFGNIDHLPKWEDIPEEFRKGRTTWNKLFAHVFYGQSGEAELEGKDGVDVRKAGRAIRAIMVSFQPKHEHKDAGCAYLMSQWFKSWSLDGKPQT